ncbi:hypothetical protein DFQ27_007619 [Actinomortierella ambigua]|uniref:CAP-Gly domain-containing protein n=1 Tax=Actinomortierella ambigua TaxID=1343610 RepID=A0A9P6PUU1_9FUNG|nr:hypothetical protein DFQ27_007619 [Actinomortierella ambigua]
MATNSGAATDFEVGTRVEVAGGNQGTVRFSGTTAFAGGRWVGIELDLPQGKNSGVVANKRYFECKPDHGLFVRPSQVRAIDDGPQGSTATPPATATASGRTSRPASMVGRTQGASTAAGRMATRTGTSASGGPAGAGGSTSSSRVAAATSRPASRRTSTLEPQSDAPARVRVAPSSSSAAASSARAIVGGGAAAAAARGTAARARATSTSSPTPTPTPVVIRGRTELESSTPSTPTVAQPPPADFPSSSSSSPSPSPTPPPPLPPLSSSSSSSSRQPTPVQQHQHHPSELSSSTLEDIHESSQLARDSPTPSEPESVNSGKATPPPNFAPKAPPAAVSLPAPAPPRSQLSSMPSGIPLVGGGGGVGATGSLLVAPKVMHQQQQQQQQQPPSLASLGPAQRMEASVPLKDYEELRIKLRILEAKRTEDRERLKEAERIKEESEQFQSMRPKLQAKLAEMQQELRDAKRALKDAVSDKDSFEGKYNDTLDSLEVALLDKEMAEEKAETLQHEVNTLKEKVEEQTVDLRVLQNEDSGTAGMDAVRAVQVERQNERLQEALIRLRDVTSEQEAELQRKIRNLEREASSLQEVQAENEKLKESVETAENQIEDLKQRLDDAIGAEDMIEQLSEKNILLTEKVEEQQAVIDDLEALKELNDEMEEAHQENAKQMQAEINLKDTQLREHQKRIEAQEESMADYENTILQFREYVATLQADLEQMRQREEARQAGANGGAGTGGAGGVGGIGTQSQAMLSLNLQLQSTAMKAQAKAIDLELRKLDALQANDNLQLVQPYLPERFFKTENDSIQCFLLFKRLAYKADLMIKHLEQQYNIAEKIVQTQVPQELVATCEVRQRLAWFGDLSKRFVSYIEGCPVEVFGKMGQVYHDLLGTERRLDNWVSLLRKEELNETECVVDLKRAISQLDHLAETYLTATKLDLADRYYGTARALDLNLDRMVVNLSTVNSMLAQREDGFRVVDTDDVQYQLTHTLMALVTQAKSGKVATRKILRRLDELAAQTMVVPSESLLSQYRNVSQASSKLGEFTYEFIRSMLTYIRQRREGSSTAETIQVTIANVTDAHLGVSETSMLDGCRKLLNGLLQDLSSLLEGILEPDVATKVTKAEKAWVLRAKDIKAEVVVNTDAEQKAQSLQDQVLKLVKDAKLKDQALQESNVKIDLLNKRMETFKKQAEQISYLDQNIDKAKSQEKAYEELIQNLQTDIADMQQENAQLKRALRKTENRGMMSSLKRPTVPGVPGSPGSTVAGAGPGNGSTGSLGGSMILGGLDQDGMVVGGVSSLSLVSADGLENLPSRELLVQMESLKAALRYVRSENAALRTRAAMQDLGLSNDMSLLHLPLSQVHLEGTAYALAESAATQKEDARMMETIASLVAKKKASTAEASSSAALASIRSGFTSSGRGGLTKAEELKAVALESRKLLREARWVCASPKVVDLTLSRQATLAAVGESLPMATAPTTETEDAASSASAKTSAVDGSASKRPARWQSLQTRPEWQYHTQQAVLTTIGKRSVELREKLARLSRPVAGSSGSSTANTTTTLMTTTTTKLQKLSTVVSEKPIARVRFPPSMSALCGPVAGHNADGDSSKALRKDLSVYLKSPHEFEAVHNLFVR